MKKIHLFVLFFALNISSDLYITDENIHSNISKFMNEILPGQEFTISSDSVEGSRDKFHVKKLKISSPFFGELIKLNNLSCSGYKINDYEMNMLFERDFKIPSFEDIENSFNVPSNCLMEGLNIPFFDNMTKISPEFSKYSYLTSLLTDIDIEINFSHVNGEFRQNLNMNLSERIYITNDYEFTGDIKAMYFFINKFIENIVYQYWGYKNYSELYADTSGDTSEIYLDFISDLSSNPLSYFEILPSIFPELLMKKSSFQIMWSEKEYNGLVNNFPEIEGFLFELKKSVKTKLSLEEFIEQTSDLALNDLPLPGSDEFNALYNFYSSGVDMLREFAETPRGIGMTILSKEGLNIIPDKQVLNDFLVDEKNKEIGLEQLPTILMISRLGESLDSMEITLKANPGTN
jgi:hypothetical protein